MAVHPVGVDTEEGRPAVRLEAQGGQLEVPIEAARPALGAVRDPVEALLEAGVEEEVGVLPDLDGGPHLPGEHLQPLPVDVPVELLRVVDPDEVGAEGAPGRGAGHVAQLVTEAGADLGVVVDGEGLVPAAPHRPEEARPDGVAPGRGVAEAGEEEPGRASVAADRVVHVRQVEGGDRFDLEQGVLRDDLVVDVDAGARGGELPARVRLGAGREPAPLHLVGFVVDALDPAPLDEDAGLHVADGVLHESPSRLVHLETVPGEALLSPQEDHVALGHHPSDHGAVRLLLLEDVGPVGLDAHGAHPQVHEAPGLPVSGGDLLVRLRPDSHLPGIEGFGVLGGDQLLRRGVRRSARPRPLLREGRRRQGQEENGGDQEASEGRQGRSRGSQG